MARNAYNSIDRNKDEDGQPQRCEYTHEAIIAFGEGAGTITKVCTEKACAVHGFRHVPTFTPEQVATQKQRVKEEKARVKKMTERKATFEGIMSHLPHGPLTISFASCFAPSSIIPASHPLPSVHNWRRAKRRYREPMSPRQETQSHSGSSDKDRE